MNSEAKELFENKLRVRACGICFQDNSLLLVRHNGIGSNGQLWSPPGGGLKFQESAEDALIREILEETGLHVQVRSLLFVNEYFDRKLHAIELFFEVTVTGGELIKGVDPELLKQHQMIEEVRFVTFEELNLLSDEIKHNLLRGRLSKKELLNMRGYFKLWQ